MQLSKPPSEVLGSGWIYESITSYLVTGHCVSKVYYSGESQFQRVDVVEVGGYGRCLLIDGHMQSSENDEFLYHESLVQPAMILHPNPKRIFVAGGGEGATCREIFKHKSVEKVTMVDIDDIVVRVSKEHFPKHHVGAFENPKLELVCADARVYLQNTDDKFDVIVIDLPDPIEGGPAYLLYTQNFYKMVKEKLNPDGILVVQSGPGSVLTCSESFSPVYKTLSTVFDVVAPYLTHIPSFSDSNGFNMATNGVSPQNLSETEVDSRISERIVGGSSSLRFYDGITHRNLFSLSKNLRNTMAQETTIITEDNPAYCFKS
jgi:spermidine synthase